MDDDHGLRIEIPKFGGSFNLDDFIDWLYSNERVFKYKDYFDEKKCKKPMLKSKLLWLYSFEKVFEYKDYSRVS